MEAGKLPTSQDGCFVQGRVDRQHGPTACKCLYDGSCGPAPLPFPLFPRGSPSPERRGRGKKGGELPASTLSARPEPRSQIRVLLPPVCKQAEAVGGRSLIVGRSLCGRGACHWPTAPSRGGGGHQGARRPRPRSEPGLFRGPPQLHRHDTDTQSLQLLREPGALGTRRPSHPVARTPAPATPPPAPARRPQPSLGAGGGDRAPAPASGARLPAAVAAAAQLRAPGARRSRRVSEAAAAEASERSWRLRGRPFRLPAPTALRPASAPVTFSGRLPRPRAPGPAPQARARPSPAPPSRGAAGGRRRPGGRGRRDRLQHPRRRARRPARTDSRCPAAARELGRPKLGARLRSPRPAESGQALP